MSAFIHSVISICASAAKSVGRRCCAAVIRAKQQLRPTKLSFSAALACWLMAGCAAGPDFKRPAAPAVSDYTDHPLSDTVASTNVVGGEAQSFAQGTDIVGDWW